MTFLSKQKMSYAVNEAFIRLYNEGLIYRTTRLVNWCCALKSALSDIEVDKVDVSGRTPMQIPGYSQPVTFGLMYTFDYQVEGSGK